MSGKADFRTKTSRVLSSLELSRPMKTTENLQTDSFAALFNVSACDVKYDKRTEREPLQFGISRGHFSAVLQQVRNAALRKVLSGQPAYAHL